MARGFWKYDHRELDNAGVLKGPKVFVEDWGTEQDNEDGIGAFSTLNPFPLNVSFNTIWGRGRWILDI